MTGQSPAPNVRRASLEDAKLLAELGARTFDETFAKDNSPEDMAAYLADAFDVGRLTAELADPLFVYLIAEVEGSAAGYAKIRAGGASGEVGGDSPVELVRLYVSQEWLGRGVGHALMRRCIDEARGLGFRTIWLGVWERNRRAQAFYRKWDFQEVGEHIFQLGSDPQRDIVMRRAV